VGSSHTVKEAILLNKYCKLTNLLPTTLACIMVLGKELSIYTESVPLKSSY
jgi:hypothetical protein